MSDIDQAVKDLRQLHYDLKSESGQRILANIDKLSKYGVIVIDEDSTHLTYLALGKQSISAHLHGIEKITEPELEKLETAPTQLSQGGIDDFLYGDQQNGQT